MLRLLAKGSVIDGEGISTELAETDSARTAVSNGAMTNMAAGMCPDNPNATEKAGCNNESFYVKTHTEEHMVSLCRAR